MLSPGMQLGQRYRLHDRIAVGGMGEVWKAEDTVLERRVAVKVLLPSLVSEPGFAKRFQVEAKTVAALSHPHIVNVYDYGETTLDGGEQSAFLVMEYVEGRSLYELIEQRGALPAAEVMSIIAAVADALQHAHEHGVIHRDIKPGNILVRAGNGQAVLTDFGIARSGAAGDLTQTGAVMGTASYIAPEQADGTGVIPASDMYSLGVVAFHGLTGQRPFQAENPIELALHHVRTPTPALPPTVPPAVAAFVQRAMSKVPTQRFATAAEMAAAARHAASAPPPPPPTSVMPATAHALPAGAGVVGMTGPPAGVATPPGIELGAHQGGPYPPPPGGQGGGSRRTLIGILAGVLAVALAGGMVWLLLNFNDNGDPGGTTQDPGGENVSGPVEDDNENVESEDPTPSSSPSADDDDDDDDDDNADDDDDDDEDDTGPGFGCLPGANCDE